MGIEPIAADVWANAVAGSRTPVGARTPQQQAAVDAAAQAANELIAADALLFAVPLYNFGPSQHVKAWVDLVIADHRFNPTERSPLAGKPAVLAVVRGGAYGEGTPREGWDHATPWLHRILVDVWGLDLRVVENEFTLVGQVPALDQFAEVAAQMRFDAEEMAAEHGRALAASTAGSAA